MYILGISPGRGFEERRWRAVLGSGIDGLMIREKQLGGRALLELVCRVRDLAPHLELWVNGRLDVALAANCGLHAPEDYPDVPSGLSSLSRPIHEETQFPSRLPCSQLLVAPIFHVPDKGLAWGAARLHRALDSLPDAPCRILAMGGISEQTAPGLAHPRLQGVALIRSLWDSPDPARSVDKLRGAWS